MGKKRLHARSSSFTCAGTERKSLGGENGRHHKQHMNQAAWRGQKSQESAHNKNGRKERNQHKG